MTQSSENAAREFLDRVLHDRVRDVSQHIDARVLAIYSEIENDLRSKTLSHDQALRLCVLALEDNSAWDLARKAAHDYLMTATPLPTALAQFAALLVLDAEPMRKKGRPGNKGRDIYVVAVIQILVNKHKLKLYRGYAQKLVTAILRRQVEVA